MPRTHPRQHRRSGATPAQTATPTPPQVIEGVPVEALDLIAHAFLVGIDEGGYLGRMLTEFKKQLPGLNDHLFWHIEEHTRDTWVRHYHVWLREEYGEGWRDHITTTPNPHGNCDECFHPLGFYDQLFGDEIPDDIDDCECGCHQTPAEDVPGEE